MHLLIYSSASVFNSPLPKYKNCLTHSMRYPLPVTQKPLLLAPLLLLNACVPVGRSKLTGPAAHTVTEAPQQ